jgi:phage terminase large subunit
MRINLLDSINESYIPFFKTTKREALLYGGAGAGKSYAAAQKVVLYCLLYSDKKILVLRKTLPALKLTALEIIERLLRDYRIPYDINRTDLIIRTIKGNRIIFKSIGEAGEDIEKLKSLTDIDLIWIEEATELTQKEYDEVNRRLRGRRLPPGHFRQIILTFNPIDRNHWIFKRYFETPSNAFILKTTYKDNKFLDPEYARMLENLKQQDEYAYQVYCLGEWGVFRGQVYTNYAVENFEYGPEDFDEVIAGIDFGFNNPTALLLIGIKDREVFVFDEFYRSHLTMPEIINAIKEKFSAWGINSIIYSEHDPEKMRELELAGFYVLPAKKDVLAGISFVRSLRLHIHARCVNTIREIQGYKYKEDRNGNILEEPVKFNDHAMDALRYAVYTHLSQDRFTGIVYLNL